MSTSRSTSKRRQEENPIKPWHIAVFAVALLVIGWQVIGMARQSFGGKDGKIVATPPELKTKMPPASAGAGTGRMMRDKDREE